MAKKITLTKTDYERLRALAPADPNPLDPDKGPIRELMAELDRAVIVEGSRVDAEIVTMNSQVRIRDLDTGEENEYTLVYPLDADIRQGRISILVPLGTALIGYRKGDVLEWKVPGGIRKFKILKVLYQPEASGDLDS
ncbi:MAG: nucleoside diphosphate kinase regulator [Acidobacteriota bacterium]|nr:nucleoside diphosphate kinase regulator [Acidobacteriota bacterium]